MKVWEIQYSQNDGPAESIRHESEEKPSLREAATVLLYALNDPVVIPNVPRNINSEDKAVHQLKTLGVHIIDIVEVPTN